jgi:hypothetical protein
MSSSEEDKLLKIMEHVQILVDELPLDDADVRDFLKTIDVTVWNPDNGGWKSIPMSPHPSTLYGYLEHGRGNHEKRFDPFYMIHEIKLAYSDKNIDKKIRQIVSYFEALMFFYRNYEIQTELARMRGMIEAKQTVLGEGGSQRVDFTSDTKHRDGDLLFRIQSL